MNPCNGLRYIIDMSLRVYPARYGQAHQFQFGGYLLTRFGIFPGEHDAADLHSPDTCFPVKLDAEGLAGEFERRDMRQHGPGINVHGMPPHRPDDGDAGI